MAKVTITIETKPVELMPGEEEGILRLKIDSHDGSHLEAQMDSNTITFPDMTAGKYTVTVQRLDQNGIGIGDPVVEEFEVMLDQVRTTQVPSAISVSITK